MAVEAEKSGSDGKLWSLFKMPFWQSGNASSSSSSTLSSMHHNVHHQLGQIHESAAERMALHSASTVSYVTKSLLPARRRLRLDPPNKLFFPCKPLYLHLSSYLCCYVNLAIYPIYGLKSAFDEQRDEVVVEQVLRVVFLDPEHPTPAMDKLKRQLAEAEAALETRKKPPEEAGPRIVGEGLVIDEWKERRERYLAQQQVEGADSV
ncbi:unnamed protein product [Malus baccata var. baccata]